MMSTKKEIPVFFSVDHKYIPFLGVAIHSLKKNLSKNSHCTIHVLYTNIPEDLKARITALSDDRADIRFTNVEKKVSLLAGELNLRDYYTISIYYRLFIASMFPQYHKAIYLDADVVLNDDITGLYDQELGDNLVGAASDAIVYGHPDFVQYAKGSLGIDAMKYFNSGVLLMNLDEFRRQKIGERFVELLNKYHFDTICPDQDYLNHLCRGQVLYLDKGWNKMSLDEDYDGVPHLIHYNMFYKPWQYDDICYESYFWKFAKETAFYDEILAIKAAFGEADKEAHRKANETLHANAIRISKMDHNFYNTLVKGKQESKV
ncbi:MAG: glycosyltransferase family 8 protein [Clostridia bacterium]|nr:glycosyltransferase family 8 protein [Clostridia bacterium]